VIPSINGFPGIFSARIASTDEGRIHTVLEKMRGHKDRTAFYHCTMICKTSEGIAQSTGRCDGRITEESKGTSGFGYDPIFESLEAGKTFGEMKLSEKLQYSHRGRAVHQIIPEIRRLLKVIA
jgi:XTP/dITP diphosphohydrolase